MFAELHKWKTVQNSKINFCLGFWNIVLGFWNTMGADSTTGLIGNLNEDVYFRRVRLKTWYGVIKSFIEKRNQAKFY